MTLLLGRGRALLIGLALIAAPAIGQDTMAPAPAPEVTAPAEMAWQEIVSNQIQAFRDHNAPGAFMYAAAAFQTSYPSAEAFFVAIVNMGYAPIMESTSHSFGAFRMVDDTIVIQEVGFVGKDQERYGAIYQLGLEESGWRVQGVQLFRQQGIAI
jgi:hypothetical protein